MFTNQPFQIQELPQIETVDFNHLNEKLKSRGLYNRLIFCVLLLTGPAVVYFTAPNFVFYIALSAVLFVSVILLVWPFISYPKKTFAVREHDILYQSGVFWNSFKAIPFNRLQHIELTRSPIDRMLGLSSLVFYTAGGSYGDLRINGFTDEEANKIREQILLIMKKENNDQSE